MLRSWYNKSQLCRWSLQLFFTMCVSINTYVALPVVFSDLFSVISLSDLLLWGTLTDGLQYKESMFVCWDLSVKFWGGIHLLQCWMLSAVLAFFLAAWSCCAETYLTLEVSGRVLFVFCGLGDFAGGRWLATVGLISVLLWLWNWWGGCGLFWKEIHLAPVFKLQTLF